MPRTKKKINIVEKPIPSKLLSKNIEKKIKKRRKESFSSYIYKVLKYIDNDIGISSRTMLIMNSFVRDIIERMASQASKLVNHRGGSTLTYRDFQSATRLLLPGELAKHAVLEAFKSLEKYKSYAIDDASDDA